ncbi:hypothetical protein Tco_1444538 [Tanacetum coccineum]
MEEMLYKFIDEGKREQEEIRAFIHEFRTTNELLFKERNNLLSGLRLRKEKEEAQQKNFLENLKKLHINLPFIEAIAQMPKYAKGLKGLLTNRARLEEACTNTMNERCSAVRDDEVIFNMDQSITRSPIKDDECYWVDDLDDAINAEAQELLVNDTTDSFLLKGLEKSIEQTDLKSYECEAADDSDSIRRIKVVNTPCPVEQKMA